MQEAVGSAVKNVRYCFCTPIEHVPAENAAETLLPLLFVVADGVDFLNSFGEKGQEKLVLLLFDVNIRVGEEQFVEKVFPHVQ